jgi:hypothetical protein
LHAFPRYCLPLFPDQRVFLLPQFRKPFYASPPRRADDRCPVSGSAQGILPTISKLEKSKSKHSTIRLSYSLSCTTMPS